MINRNKLILLVLSLFLSCINNEKEKKQELEKSISRKIKNKADITDHFQVILKFKALENDHFQLFYTQDYILNYTEDDSISKEFLGKDEYQDIIFDLPKEILPVKYRLDIGSNEKQSMINIESLTIRYKKNEIFIPENLIATYLVPNKCIEYNSTQNNFELTITQTDNIKIYDPYFTSSPELVRLLLDL
jgi:hypothetical protein